LKFEMIDEVLFGMHSGYETAITLP
jgi:hypothetical protein